MAQEALKELSTEELEAVLEARKKAEKEAKEKAKEEYIARRNDLVERHVARALDLHMQLEMFKAEVANELEELRIEMELYGGIRSNSKGGFSIRSSNNNQRVALVRNSVYEYDERGEMAVNLIREFLEDSVKKRNVKDYRALSTLLQKNRKGDLHPSRVASFLSIKDNYDDPRWKKAMDLFEEGYREREVSYNIEFSTPDESGKDKNIVLTFASL